MVARTLLASSAALLLMACSGNGRPPVGRSSPEAEGQEEEPVEFEIDEDLEGLRLRLSEVERPAPSPGPEEVAPQPAEIEVLTAAEAAALVGRLPPLELADGDRKPVAIRDPSRPPPRTGADVAVPFPPPERPDVPEVDEGPLRLVRFAPEGAVPIAPHLSVTFSAPMVAITSQDAASEVRPVRIAPEPEGTWRWVGTRTLLFEPDPRFPMATRYTVEVPDSVTSARGGAIEAGRSWTFETPPPSVQAARPQGGPHDLEPLLYLAFDQAVDPDAMAAHVELQGRGAPPLRLATDAEIESEPWAVQAQEASPDGRLLFLRPTEPLQPDTHYVLTVTAGAPSAEGPLTTTKAQRFDFFTYPPLTLSDTWCDRDNTLCSPGGTFSLHFTNPIDADAFDPALVTVEPPVDSQRVRLYGDAIHVSGALHAGDRHTVTVSPELRDVFGQTLSGKGTANFRVGPADERLVGPPRDLVVLDPAAPPALSVFSTNLKRLKVRVFEVGPDQFAAVSAWMRDARYDGYRKGEPPARKLAATTLEVPGYVDDELVETPIDLSPWLGDDGFGHLLLWIEPPTQPKDRWAQTHHFAWVQRTAIGLTAVVDADEVTAWTTSLADGRPLDGVQVSLLGDDAVATSDADGLAALAKYPDSAGPHGLVARRGPDVALLPAVDGWWNQHGAWQRYEPGERISWFVFDDRRMYRPGETVSIKGWMRRFDAGAGGGIVGTEGLPSEVTWQLWDSVGSKLAEGRAAVSEAGGFDLQAELPDTPNLGSARLTLHGSGGEIGGSTTHSFQIQEFRRPEFEVTTHLDPRPYVLGEHAVFSVNAAYYAGGALPAAPVRWEVTSSPASYSPPGLDDYRFGPWSPWWGGLGMWGRGGFGGMPGAYVPPEVLEGTTDASGEHRLRVDFVAVNPPRPYTVRAEASVVDVNRQRWTRGEQLLMHPAAHYVGVRTDKGFYERGDTVQVDLVIADLDGDLVEGRAVDVRFARLEWGRKDGRWQQIETDARTCAVTSGAEAVDCGFEVTEGGSYQLVARTTDPEGRPNETALQVWVAGGVDKQAPQRQVAQEQLTLVPDAERYQPGDTARVLVVSPFPDGEGLLVIARNGIMERRRFTLQGTTATLEVPIGEESVPNVAVHVEVVGNAERRDDEGDPLPDKARRVAFATGELSLPVPPLSRTLQVSVAPREDAVDPGGSTVLEVEVRDASGAPVQGEVALLAVDEAVLALTDFTTPDPIAVFYAQQGSGLHLAHLRQQVVLSDPEAAGAAGSEGDLADQTVGALGGSGHGYGGGGMAEGAAFAAPMEDVVDEAEPVRTRSLSRNQDAAEAPPPPATAAREKSIVGGEVAGGQAPVSMREDFTATALFAPRVTTDASGRATVPLTVPDSLTRYRILAVAVAGDDRFGAGESTLTARKPVMLRPSPPRFLNFGDRMELPLVVQNQTDEPVTVEVGLAVANASVLDDLGDPLPSEPRPHAGRRLEVPANDRRELRIPVAADMAGTARFQAVAVSGAHTDAAAFAFPVWTPATSEAFATYGEIDGGAIVQPVEAPDAVWPQVGGLEITTSTTALQALTDALLYLVQYPYDCTEQMASRVMAVAALKDVLTAFEADGLPEPEALEQAVARDLTRITKRQHGNGGFSFWPDLPDEPYLTVHITHALVRAKAKGFDVDGPTLDRALRYLRSVERHIPWYYGDRARWSIVAYSVHVRHLIGDDDIGRARKLVREAGLDRLPLEAQGWIAPVLAAKGAPGEAAALLRHWENRATETASTAQFDAAYSDQGDHVLLHSSRRTDAVLLEALIEVDRDHDLIPKLTRGLLAHRRAGRWSTTQENSFVLLALDRYFRTYEATAPDLVARVWLGDDYAGDHAFRGRTTERATIEVPMAWLTDPGGVRDLVVQNDGTGRLYYRIGLRYAPKDLTLEPADHGFAVERVYESIDDPADVRRDPDGTWRIRSGARVRVRVTMVAQARRYHVALVDPLPGGLEPQNPELAVTGTVPADPKAQEATPYWWWRGPWYEHQNLRDERVEAFTSQLWDGVHEYTYVATATTPGRFVVPPAKAEEMYAPETFGRSGTDRVIIE